MRDLTTIAACEQEARKRLKDVRLAMFNKRASLDRDLAEEARLLEELNTLEAEAVAFIEQTRHIGTVHEEPLVEGAAAGFTDAKVQEAFERATTPQGEPNGGAIF